jgi:hypothetical protein
MSASLARYLKDFSAPPPPLVEDDFDVSFDGGSAFIEPAAPEIDLEEERRIAFEEGRAAMRAELEEEHSRQIEEISQARADAEAEMVDGFEKQMSEAIVQAMAGIEHALSERLSGELLDALMPIVDEQITRKAVDALAASVISAFQEEGGVELVLRGSANLAGRLSKLLDESGFRLRHIEAPGVDLTVEYGETLFATRLAAWRDGVEELLT